MRIFVSKKPLVLFISIVFIFTFCLVTSMAQQMTKIAGKMTNAYTMQQALNVGDTEDHIISIGQSEGINVSTGENKFMDGARVVNMSFNDIVKGNGPHQGYIKLFANGDSVFAGWNGKIATVFSAEGTPVTTFGGIFTYIKGTGQFKNIQGSGTFEGKFISEKEYVVDWEGQYFIKK